MMILSNLLPLVSSLLNYENKCQKNLYLDYRPTRFLFGPTRSRDPRNLADS